MKVKEAIEQLNKIPNNDDLWKQLDEVLQGAEETRPADSFTCIEYRKRYKLTDSVARRKLRILGDLGKIRRCGKGINTYYVLVKP